MTPRPSRTASQHRHHRAMSAFASESADQSSDSMSDDSSDDEGPFMADDIPEREMTPAFVTSGMMGMQMDIPSPGGSVGPDSGGALGGGGGLGAGMQTDQLGLARRGVSGRSSTASLSAFGGTSGDDSVCVIGFSVVSILRTWD